MEEGPYVQSRCEAGRSVEWEGKSPCLRRRSGQPQQSSHYTHPHPHPHPHLRYTPHVLCVPRLSVLRLPVVTRRLVLIHTSYPWSAPSPSINTIRVCERIFGCTTPHSHAHGQALSLRTHSDHATVLHNKTSMLAWPHAKGERCIE